jgi:PncC family amidohydrolase
VVVTAESCTAGLIASRLAAAPGAGQVLECAFVVYDPKAKRRCLGVPAEVLERNNLTSEPVALEMARGALRHSDANVAVSNTGVADDSDPEIAAGHAVLRMGVPRWRGAPREFTETRVFEGERNEIREASADYALGRIVHYHAQCRRCNTAPDSRREQRRTFMRTTEKKEPMNTHDLDHRYRHRTRAMGRSTLDAREAVLAADLRTAAAELPDAARRPTDTERARAPACDPIDIADERLQNGLRYAEAERDMAELRDIDAARERLENGEFGRCIDCGTAIPRARLQAMPASARCIACQERHEQDASGRGAAPAGSLIRPAQRPAPCTTPSSSEPAPRGCWPPSTSRASGARWRLLDAGQSRVARIPQSHNYPGFGDGVSGVAVRDMLRAQVGRYPVDRIDGFADHAERREEGGFRLHMRTGALDVDGDCCCSPRASPTFRLRCRIVREALEAGVLRYCPVCDAYEVIGQAVGVYSDGEAGIGEALYLRHFGADITLFMASGRAGAVAAGAAPPPCRGRRPLERGAHRGDPPRGRPCGRRACGRHRVVRHALLRARRGGAFADSRSAWAPRSMRRAMSIDAHHATAVPGLYAAGDVCTGLNQIAVALGGAAIAASAMHRALPPDWPR